MVHSEVDSFVTKFKHLCHAGFRATLTIEAVNWEASVVLKSFLGALHAPGHHGQPPRRRGPAYQRRQERRQAAKAAAGQDPSLAVKVSDAPPSDDVNSADEAGATSEHSEATTADDEEANSSAISVTEKSAEKAEKNFSCLICDFTSNWENGLHIHMARKHNNIQQVDGNATFDSEESDDDKKYSGTHSYWKTGRLGTIFQSFLDANEIIENSNLEVEIKMKEKEKILEARKFAFKKDFRDFPPWN